MARYTSRLQRVASTLTPLDCSSSSPLLSITFSSLFAARLSPPATPDAQAHDGRLSAALSPPRLHGPRALVAVSPQTPIRSRPVKPAQITRGRERRFSISTLPPHSLSFLFLFQLRLSSCRKIWGCRRLGGWQQAQSRPARALPNCKADHKSLPEPARDASERHSADTNVRHLYSNSLY